MIDASSSYAKSSAGRAEVAFVVDEDYHRLGIAGRLLHHLGYIAVERGITVFAADVLAEMTACSGCSGLLPGRLSQKPRTAWFR